MWLSQPPYTPPFSNFTFSVSGRAAQKRLYGVSMLNYDKIETEPVCLWAIFFLHY